MTSNVDKQEGSKDMDREIINIPHDDILCDCKVINIILRNISNSFEYNRAATNHTSIHPSIYPIECKEMKCGMMQHKKANLM